MLLEGYPEEIRRKAAEILYAQKMHGCAPGPRMPQSHDSRLPASSFNADRVMVALRAAADWLPTSTIARRSDIGMSRTSHALSRLHLEGKVQKRMVRSNLAEFRAVPLEASI